MRKRLVYILMLAIALSLTLYSVIGAQEGSYFIVPIKGDIDDGTFIFIRRALKEAKQEGLSAVVFDIDTYGGLVDASNRIRDEILASDIRTIAFVDQKAWSAGALVAISCTELHMNAGSTIGAAETRPAEEKYISAYREQFESTASERGRDPLVAGAMVDSDIVIAGLKEKGKILTLGSEDALSLGFADGVHQGLVGLIKASGLESMRRIDFSMNNSEKLGQFLTSPIVSELLIVVGVLGLIIEAFVPGFGIFGGAGVVGFALFFYGRLITGMAGWEVVILFLVGLVLLIIELFIPGFGIVGATGLVAIFSSFILSYPTTSEALLSVSIALAFTIAAIIILVRTLEKRGIKGNSLFGRLILTEVTGKDITARHSREYREKRPEVGEHGVVYTTLRPVGTAYFGQSKVDVLSEGEFLPPNTEVVVERIDGMKVIVRKLGPGNLEEKGVE